MKSFCGILFCIYFFLSTPLNADAQLDSAGIIKAVSGHVFITRSQTAIKTVSSMRIIRGDSIKTGPKSGAVLIFEDDTVVALGPNSEMNTDNVHEPKNRRIEAVVR